MREEMHQPRPGKLYLLPVPLGDSAPASVLPAGNIETARRLKVFVVENIRSARRFLKKCDKAIDIDSITFFELSEHTAAADIPAMLGPLLEGADTGVISEAGCPAVADPGADLVAAAQARGIEVVPLVGPSSILLSLMASGFNGQSFAFRGYLPVDSGARLSAMREMERRARNSRETQIFIETPYRNNRLVEELCRSLPGDMMLCVAADITEPGQNIRTMTLSRWHKTKYDFNKIPAIFLLSR